MYEHLLKLVSRSMTKDELGNSLEVEHLTMVLARLIQMGHIQESSPGVEGKKLQLRFAVHDFEFSGETYLYYSGEKPFSHLNGRYEIKSTSQGTTFKTRHLSFDEIELICEKVGEYD